VQKTLRVALHFLFASGTPVALVRAKTESQRTTAGKVARVRCSYSTVESLHTDHWATWLVKDRLVQVEL